MYHSESGNKCFWKQPDLYVWNSGTGISSFPEIPTAAKTGILHKQQFHSFGDIGPAQQLSKLQFSDCIGKLILSIFSLSILVYHKISTFLCMVLIRGNLIIPKIWCCFNVNESFIKLFCLKIQALVAFILLGKLSY